MRDWLAENPNHVPAPRVTPSKGLQSLPICMKRVLVERKFLIRHLCDSMVFSNVSSARTWFKENPDHKPCPTLWFKGNADTEEDDQADISEAQEDLDADEDEVGSMKHGDVNVKEVMQDNAVKSGDEDKEKEKGSRKTITSKESETPSTPTVKDCETEVNQENDGFDADSEDADIDDEKNKKKKNPKGKPPAGGKALKRISYGSGDASSRATSSSFTGTNPPPCMKRKEKKEKDKRLSGFIHLCDSHWFPSWKDAKEWLVQNPDHFSSIAGIESSEKEALSGKKLKAIKQPEALLASSKKKLQKNQIQKKAKQTNISPLATLQAAVEEEVSSSHTEVSGEKSPDMFDSEEGGDDGGGETMGTGKVIQYKKSKKNKAPESCKEPPTENEESESEDSGEEMGNSKSRMIGRQLEKELEQNSLTIGESSKEGTQVGAVDKAGTGSKVKNDEKTSSSAGSSNYARRRKHTKESSSSSDSGSETEGFSGTEQTKNSIAGKKVIDDAKMKRKTDQSSSSESDSESESEGEVADPKSPTEGANASITNKTMTGVSPSKGGSGGAQTRDIESSNSESESETEARQSVITKSTSAAVQVAPNNSTPGFGAPRLESFQKAGLPSPGSTATTSGLKGTSTNTSVYDSPKNVQPTQESSSGISESSGEESSSSGEETRRNVTGVKKMKKVVRTCKVRTCKKTKKEVRTSSSSSESESGSDSSDNEESTNPEPSKTSSTQSKLTGKNHKEEMSSVRSLPLNAASTTKTLKTKAKKPTEPVSNSASLKTSPAKESAATQPVSKARLVENVAAPVTSSGLKATPAKASLSKASPTKACVANASLDLGNKKKAKMEQIKEKGEPAEKLAKLQEKKMDSFSPSKTNRVSAEKLAEEKADDQQISEKSQSDNFEKKQKDSSSPSKTKGVQGEKNLEKKTISSSEKKSPQLSSTLVPRNVAVEKLKIQEMDCSPILKKVKDAFGSYFEKTMMEGEDTGKMNEEAENGTQGGKEGNAKKKKKNKKEKKPEAGFL